MSTKKLVLILIALGVLVYVNSLSGAFINDDNGQIVKNKLILSLLNLPLFFQGSTFYTGGDTLTGFFYRPLFVTYFSAIATIFGITAFWFHFYQVILHIANTLLFFHILRNWFSKNLSFIISGLFLVHPMNVEAISFISSSGTILFCFFGLLALLLLIEREETPLKYVLVGVSLLASALSQETGLLFILILFAYKLIFQKKEMLLYVISSCLIGAIYFILRFGVAHIYLPDGERTPILMATMAERLINIPRIIFFYISTFILPLNLGFYQIWLIKQTTLLNFYLPALFVLLLAISLFVLGSKLYHSSKEKFKIFCFFTAWVASGSVLLLQIIPADLTVAERWFYLPMMGILGIVGLTIQKMGWEKKRILVVILIVIICLFGTRSFIRNLDWNNGISLYSHDLQQDPDNYALQAFLGTEYGANGDYDSATVYLEKSVSHEFIDQHALNNLAKIYYLKGDLEQSKETLKKSIQYNETIDADENLAYLLLVTNENPTDVETFIVSKANQIQKSWKLWMYSAIIKYHLGNRDEALQAAEKAYILSPNQSSAYVRNQITTNQPINPDEL